tara:strand:- start:75 stop:239 length:165 start_codon:yes stop_codon:yes gene_type:complete
MIKKITEAILNINSNAIFSIQILKDQTVDDCTIVWHEGTTEISRADIKAEMDKL